MKSILISIKPEWVAKILSGEKTIEIRKTAPKCELPINVYIYCTKGDNLFRNRDCFFTTDEFSKAYSNGKPTKPLNGKVVAVFTLDRVEPIEKVKDLKGEEFSFFDCGKEEFLSIFERSCLTAEQYSAYRSKGWIYAWYISYLWVFDKPMELSEFARWGFNAKGWIAEKQKTGRHYGFENALLQKHFHLIALQKPPQSWMYVEVGK